MVFGIDIGTTSVAGVAVGSDGQVLASTTLAHHADLPTNGNGVDEQDPAKLLAAVESVKADLLTKLSLGDCPHSPRASIPQIPHSSFSFLHSNSIGWTGQMHGVVAVGEQMDPISPFVTWRDARRYGGVVMAQWGQSLVRGQSPFKRGQSPFKCLPVCGLPQIGKCQKIEIDPSFLESWHLERGTVPAEWLPDVVEGSMLGDNQAGVYAAQQLVPGCAVVNLGTSGQLSLVVDGDCPQQSDPRIERRWFPGGRTLLCRASLVGGQAWAALQRETGLSWEDLNEVALSKGDSPLERRAHACVREIVDDLVAGFDLRGVKGIVGVGNALVRNPALRDAVEERFDLPCILPQISEMAAYGAALYKMNAMR